MKIERNNFRWESVRYHAKETYEQNKRLCWVFGVLLFLLIPIVCWRPSIREIRNDRMLYQVNVPANWDYEISTDKMKLTMTRRQSRSYGKAEVLIETELGNPYGKSGFDYIYNGLMPRLKYTHPDTTIKIQDYPYVKLRNGIKWGVFAYSVDMDVFYNVYATVANDYVYRVILTCSGKNQLEIEKEFHDIIYSFTMDAQDRTNVFLDDEANNLFEHPL